MIKNTDLYSFKKEKMIDADKMRQKINDILLIHPSKRSKAQEIEIAELLLDYPAFQSLAEEDFQLLQEMSKEIYMECLLPDTTIFEQVRLLTVHLQGDDPDNCYVILQGHVSVYVTFTYKKFEKVKTKTVTFFLITLQKYMCDMSSRQIFGELSLLFRSQRTAKIVSQESTYVLVITKQVFDKFLRKPLLKSLNIVMSFFKKMSFMDILDNRTLLILASKTQLLNLQSNTLVCRQGAKSKYIYFIKSGQVKVLKNIEILKIPQSEINLENYKQQFKEPTLDQKQQGQVDQILLEMVQIGSYECFGEDEKNTQNFLLTPQQLSEETICYSIVTSSPLQVYALRKKDFYEYLTDRSRIEFLKFIRVYPQDKDLRRYYLEQKNWIEYRHKFNKERVRTPVQIKRDGKYAKANEEEDREREKVKQQIILPKINKRGQNRQKIMEQNRIRRLLSKNERQMSENKLRNKTQRAGSVLLNRTMESQSSNYSERNLIQKQKRNTQFNPYH